MTGRAVAIALLALSLFMTWGFLRADVDASAPATFLAALIAIALPAAGGIWLLTRGGRHRRDDPRKAALRRQTLESEVLRLAGKRDGRLTAVEVVTELAIPAEEAKNVLDALARRDLAEIQVTESGVLVYSFHDVRHLREKQDARGILDA